VPVGPVGIRRGVPMEGDHFGSVLGLQAIVVENGRDLEWTPQTVSLDHTKLLNHREQILGLPSQFDVGGTTECQPVNARSRTNFLCVPQNRRADATHRPLKRANKVTYSLAFSPARQSGANWRLSSRWSPLCPCSPHAPSDPQTPGR
jgi:hypothetical protein